MKIKDLVMALQLIEHENGVKDEDLIEKEIEFDIEPGGSGASWELIELIRDLDLVKVEYDPRYDSIVLKVEMG